MNKSQVTNFILEVVVTDRLHCIKRGGWVSFDVIGGIGVVAMTTRSSASGNVFGISTILVFYEGTNCIIKYVIINCSLFLYVECVDFSTRNMFNFELFVIS